MEGFGQFLYQNIVDECFSPINRARFMSLPATIPALSTAQRSINIVSSNAKGIELDLTDLKHMLPPDPKNNLPHEETEVRYCRFVLLSRAGLLIIRNYSAPFSTYSLASITLAVLIVASSSICGCLPACGVEPRPSSPSLLTWLYYFVRRENFAYELRAVAPIAKGSEIFFSYLRLMRVRDERRGLLNKYGFICHCEMCALPDRLSDALDAKINLVKDASTFEFLREILSGPNEDNIRRGLSTLETIVAISTEERLLDTQTLMTPFAFLFLFRRLKLVGKVGQVLLSVFRRYCGPGSIVVKYISGCLDNPRASPAWNLLPVHWASQAVREDFDEKLETMAANVVSSLRKLL
jgi:hypothetical protein